MSAIEASTTVNGFGGGGDGHYLGARIGGADLVFEGNTIDDVGYLGIDVRDRATIRHRSGPRRRSEPVRWARPGSV